MRCSFCGRRSSLHVPIVILRGRRSTWDVSCCVFLRIALSGLRQVATRCKFRGRLGILWDVMKIDENRLWGTNLEVPKKTRRKTSILKLQSVKVGGGSLARNARFYAPLESLVFLWPHRVNGGKCKTSPFRRFSSKLSCRFAWQARHFVTFQPVLITCRKSFCVAGAILLRRFHKMSCSFPGRSNILEISVVILRGKRSPSDVSHCLLYTPHSTPHPLHSTPHTLHSAPYTPHSTLYTPHSTLYTPHFTL